VIRLSLLIGLVGGVVSADCRVGPVVTTGDIDDCSVSYQHAVCRGNGTDLSHCPVVPDVLELMHLAADWAPNASDVLRSFPRLQVRAPPGYFNLLLCFCLLGRVFLCCRR
jgi:hypothetical protein